MQDGTTSFSSSSKAEKEAFVTGHDGTTPWEILWVSLAGPVGVSLCQYLVQRSTNNNNNLPIKVGLEAVTVMLPMILCQSNFLYPWASLWLILQILAVLYFRQFSSATSSSAQIQPPPENHQSKPRLDYLTVYRSLVLLMTFIAILAVDFHVFPRRFAKTETQGFGLMDLGAASFAISAGIVTPKARGRPNTSKFLWHLLPLILIGIIRVVTNKGLEYQEHVSEYGVHWNFFFTMGVLAIVPRSIDHFPPSWILPTALLVIYQCHLTLLKFQQMIEEAPRNCNDAMQLPTTTFNDSKSSSALNSPNSPALILCNVIIANREGILGCFGYLALFFYGEWIGATYLWNNATTTPPKWSLERLSMLLWIGLGILSIVIPVSRRSTNASFCLWALGHNVLLLAILKHLVVDSGVPVVMESMNRNGLVMFLIANLLTGLVNLTIPTLDISDGWALLILFGYISLVGLAALLLDAVLLTFQKEKQPVHGSTEKTKAE